MVQSWWAAALAIPAVLLSRSSSKGKPSRVEDNVNGRCMLPVDDALMLRPRGKETSAAAESSLNVENLASFSVLSSLIYY